MGVKLMVEVLDHYHGPHARKLWLIAWAEKVTGDGSRTGYCKREVLVARLGRSASRVSGIARELEDEGTIKRLGGGVWGKTAVYELLPLAPAQGQPRADPTQGQPRTDPTQGQPRADPTAEPEPNSQGQPRTDAQGQPRADPNPDNPHKPSTATRRTTRTGSRGEPAATARETSRRLHNRDPRLVLLGLDETVTDAEAEAIAAALEADPDVRDPFAYLLAISAAGADQIGEFLGRMRRQLAADEPSAARPAKPPWCGECDEHTRLAELPDGQMTRCIRCHPLAQTRPAASEPPCDEPGCDGHGWIETGDGTVRRCPSHGRARQTRQHANNSPDTPRAARLADDLRDLVRGLDGDHKLTDAEVESIVTHATTDPRFRDDPLASIYDAVIDWHERNPAEGTP